MRTLYAKDRCIVFLGTEYKIALDGRLDRPGTSVSFSLKYIDKSDDGPKIFSGTRDECTSALRGIARRLEAIDAGGGPLV